MLVRRYRGKNLKDALQRVKAELGESATVLTTRTVRDGLLSTQLEVTAAAAPLAASSPSGKSPQSGISTRGGVARPAVRHVAPNTAALQRAGAGSWGRGASHSAANDWRPRGHERRSSGATSTAGRAAAVGHASGHVARAMSPLQQELQALRAELQGLAVQIRGVPGQQSGADSKRQVETRELIEVVRELHNQIAARGAGGRQQADSVSNDGQQGALQVLAQRLQRSGMSEAGRQRLLDKVARRLPVEPSEATAVVDNLAAQSLQEELDCLAPMEVDGRTPVALVGPAGVGKTTLLAKIVTRAALIEERRVAIVGCDAERIGASQALQLMAQTIGVPCRIARDADELRAAVASFAECDLVVIDTSGHSARDAEALTELRSMLDQVGAYAHLVLNADMRAMELEGVLNGYGQLNPKSVSFTRIDQAMGQGAIYDAVAVSKLPVMYLGCGRRVPDDVETATSARLAELVMGLQYN